MYVCYTRTDTHIHREAYTYTSPTNVYTLGNISISVFSDFSAIYLLGWNHLCSTVFLCLPNNRVDSASARLVFTFCYMESAAVDKGCFRWGEISFIRSVVKRDKKIRDSV